MTNLPTASLFPFTRIRRAGFDLELRRTDRGLTVYLTHQGMRVAQAECARLGKYSLAEIYARIKAGTFRRDCTLDVALNVLANIAEGV